MGNIVEDRGIGTEAESYFLWGRALHPCRWETSPVLLQKEIMDASGVSLVVIRPGTVDQARAFSQQTNFKGVFQRCFNNLSRFQNYLYCFNDFFKYDAAVSKREYQTGYEVGLVKKSE